MLGVIILMMLAGSLDYYSILNVGLLVALAFFVKKGGTVPIIIMMIYYVISMIVTLAGETGSIFTLIWAYYFFGMFYATYRCEAKKKKALEANNLA